MLDFLTGPQSPRLTLVFTSATHAWSDLFFAVLVPLLVLMREDPALDLSFTQVGLLSTVHTGASVLLQVPFGFMAERMGEVGLLLGGNIWVAVGLIAMAAVASFPLLLSATFLGGLGGATQHPLASGLVSRVYDDRGRSTAVGTVNFAGDLGKMAAPAVALLVAARFGWRATLRIVGVAGIAFMLLAAVARRGVSEPRDRGVEAESERAEGRGAEIRGFIFLSVVGFLDSAARRGALTFLPFLMRDKSMSTELIFGMLFLLLAGGAMGKFVCGWLDERYGSLRIIWATKGLTALLMLATLPASPAVMAPLMVLLGIGLNGTSSVLYATVASFVPTHLRARYYGFFYTTNEGGTTVAPIIYGLVADLLEIRKAVVVMGVVTGLILPASIPLRSYLAQKAPTSSARAR